MPKRFPLAAVLTLREQKETAEERALAAIHAELQTMRSAQAALARELAQLAASRSLECNQLLPAAHFHAVAARHEGLRARQSELQKQMILLETRKTEQQARFLAARRDRDMITQLREKHEKACATEQQRNENKRIDDLFSARRNFPL